jgi:hypothetical protein
MVSIAAIAKYGSSNVSDGVEWLEREWEPCEDDIGGY